MNKFYQALPRGVESLNKTRYEHAFGTRSCKDVIVF